MEIEMSIGMDGDRVRGLFLCLSLHDLFGIEFEERGPAPIGCNAQTGARPNKIRYERIISVWERCRFRKTI